MATNYVRQLQELLHSNAKDFEDDIDIIINQVILNKEKADKLPEVAKRLFERARKDGKIKMNESTVPSGILPTDNSATLYDVRVAGFGPDDKIYRQNKWIRENITRGMTFMEIEINGETQMDLVIYANKKFLGGVGDEDESQPENDDVWREFCLQDPESNSSKIICMKKLNGEAGHFSGRFIDGEFYVITGSKNVHMLLKDEKDIGKYSESRYAVAKIVASAVMKTLKRISSENPEKLNLLKHILDQTKMTVVCELTQPDYQHIVNLSSLTEPIINLLMFASTAEENREDSFTALAPHYGLKVGKLFGFETAQFDSISPKDVKKKVAEIRGTREEEGYVFYYMAEHGKTIGLAKVKCAWYILLRALREKASWGFCAKNIKSLSTDVLIQSTRKRFRQIQNWLKFDNTYLHNWEDIAEGFIRWLSKRISENEIQPDKIRPEFPIIWKRYLDETDSSDAFQYK